MGLTLNLKLYLVEIVLDPLVCLFPNREKHVCYEEVLSENMGDAKKRAYEQFRRRCEYEPAMHQKMASRKLIYYFCKAGEAVCLDD